MLAAQQYEEDISVCRVFITELSYSLICKTKSSNKSKIESIQLNTTGEVQHISVLLLQGV